MSSGTKDNTPIHLSIFHTNDMHGHLDEMARLSTYARELRKVAEGKGRITFLWDAGDAADRLIEICGITKGSAFPPILSAMGYTLQAMGNAISITYGPQAMPDIVARSNFPILAANCRNGDDPLVEGLKEFELIPLPNGISMGVIGLTAPIGNLYEVFGLHFPDFREVARRLVAQLKAEGVSLVVILSHLGLEDDRKLADEVEGIDLIIGGHSHDRLPNGERRNGVLITQAGDYAKAIGRIDITLNSQGNEIKSCKASLLEVPGNTLPDQAVIEAIASAEKEVDKIKAQPIGELAAALDHDFFNECDVGNMTADALRARMNADVAIVSGGLFRHALSAGVLTLGELNAACFTTANPCLSEVRGSQILEALERGQDPSICKSEPKSYRGSPVGIPQISGMTVYYDNSHSSGKRIRQVFIESEPIEKDRIYRLAHTDAEAAPNVGYLKIEGEQTIKQEVPTILREVIADYVCEHSPVPAPQRGRWLSG